MNVVRHRIIVAAVVMVQVIVNTSLALPVDQTGVNSGNNKKPALMEGLEFPNTALIPGDLTEELGVDGFFSLWFVFLDDDVFTSDKKFTILAPSNRALTRPSSPGAEDRERVRRLLLNHIVLGQAVSSADLIAKSQQPLTLTTLGGSQLHFKQRKDGIVVNGVKIMHKEVHVPHGVILVLEDYLFMDQYNGDDEQLNNQHELDDDIEFSASSNVPVASSLPKVVGGEEDHTGGDFPMIEMGTHDSESHTIMQVEPVKPEQIGAVLAERQKKMNASISTPRPFYDELVEILNFLRSGTSDFRRYLEQANISEQFKQDDNYTAFIPMDDSFAQWYPIDWGFNPFDVELFVRETILNHFVKGRHTQATLKRRNNTLTTLGGKKLKFAKQSTGDKLVVNGVEVFEGDTFASRGLIHFIGDVLFVDAAVVKDLNAKHRDVESAPLVVHPWYSSQLLSHIYRELSGRNEFESILDYVNQTEAQLRDDLPSHDDTGDKMNRYTFFVPRDSSFINLWPQDTADPFVIDNDFRHEVLLSHFVRNRLYDADLTNGRVLTMADNKTKATITRKGNETKINDAVILEKDIFIYNLGTVFIIDRVLFVNQERISQVLAKNAERLPSFAGITESSVGSNTEKTETTSESSLVIDLVAELLSGTVKPTEQPKRTPGQFVVVGDDEE